MSIRIDIRIPGVLPIDVNKQLMYTYFSMKNSS